MVLPQIQRELLQIQSQGKLREFFPRGARAGAIIDIRGKKLIDFTSWDFIGLHNNPKVRRAAQETIEQYGLSSGSSRAASGTLEPHLSLESALAKFFSCDSALLFSSRNQAILSLITALCGERDVLYFDDQCQAPIADCAHLVNASAVPLQLRTISESDFKKHMVGSRRGVLFIESISPITGQVANLASILLLAQRSGVQVVVDESYAATLHGNRGAGVSEAPLLGSVELRECLIGIVCDLAIGFGTSGCALAAPRTVTELIRSRSRTFYLETSTPALFARACEAAIILTEERLLVRQALELTFSKFVVELKKMLLLPQAVGPSAIVSIPVKNLAAARELSAALFQRGLFVEPLPLSVPFAEGACVRLIITSSHTTNHLAAVLEAFAEMRSRILPALV